MKAAYEPVKNGIYNSFYYKIYFNMNSYNFTCSDHNESKTCGMRLQRERSTVAKIFYIVQIVWRAA